MAISIDLTSSIAYYEMGLPFTVEGRIAAEEAPPVRYNSGSAPITASGRLAVSTAPVARWTTGIPYVADGAVCIELQEAFEGVTITQQPQNISVTEGEPAVFTVVAISGDGSPLTYQWQQLILAVWTDLTDVPPFTGTTTDTLTIDPAELVDTGDQFRVIVTNNVDSATSVVVTLTVTALETFYILAENGDFCITEDGLDNMVTELAA
jgi:hypothetical protein